MEDVIWFGTQSRRIERVHLDVPAAQGKRDEYEEESKDAVKPRRFTEAAGSRYSSTTDPPQATRPNHHTAQACRAHSSTGA